MKTRSHEESLPDVYRKQSVNILEIMALALVIVAALSLFAVSLFYGARIRPSMYQSFLRVDLFEENEMTNLLAFILMLATLAFISRTRITRSVNRFAGLAVLMLLTGFGVAWVLSISGEPTYDAGTLYNILVALRTGTKDTTFLHGSGNVYRYYLVSYPFQFGYLSYMDLILAIIGKAHFIAALRGTSVLLIVAAYAGIMLLTQELFSETRVTFMTILLLAVCIQPVLYAAAGYSQIPSLAASVWGVYFVVRYLKSKHWKYFALAAILLAFAVYIKPNAWIVVMALCIVLVLDAIRNKTWSSVAAAVAIVALAIPAPKLIQLYYEEQTGTTYGQGYPMVNWIAMSLQDGDQTAGWYDHSYNVKIKSTFGEDMEATKEQNIEDIRIAFANFRENPALLWELCLEKFGTQWLEPTFMSIWATNGGEGAVPQPKNAFAEFIYSDTFDAGLRFVMRFYVIFLYGGYLLAALYLLKNRSDTQMILPLIILGGILYHLVFEAQSRYALSYLPLFVPVAAYGIFQTGKAIERLVKRMDRHKKLELEEPSN